MTEQRAGNYINNLSGEQAFRSFRPAPLPPNPPLEIDAELLELLITARGKLELLNGLANRIPSMNLFLSMYIRKEALLSSQIEGTQATLDDVLDPLVDANANQNVADVINYIRAAQFAVERLHTLPLCNRLIREIHAKLMEGVRGQEKEPGEFRRSQNWIGAQGSTLRNARYIPPNPVDMKTAISDLEKYMNAEDSLDPLIRIALIHYQFETIHPFLDGNGRVGRLLIPLYLMEHNILSSPALYISYYLKLNRVEYYDRMSEVRRTGNYEQWVKFFVRAARDSAEDAITTIDQLWALHQTNEQRLSAAFTARSRKNAARLFAYLEENPIIEIQKTAADLEVAYNTASRMVATLVDLQILHQVEKSGKTRIYAYEDYLSILRKDTEPF